MTPITCMIPGIFEKLVVTVTQASIILLKEEIVLACLADHSISSIFCACCAIQRRDTDLTTISIIISKKSRWALSYTHMR